jgi:predicted HicB family RNase H-like nuclease
MANLLVKEIEKELLAKVNYAAAMANLTQREWVIQKLEEAVSVPPPAHVGLH